MTATTTMQATGRRVGALRSCTDDELVLRFQTERGNEVVKELMRRYEGSIHNVARRFFVPGGDHDDVRQQAMIGFWKAVRDYSPRAGSRFPGFAQSCMERQVITAVKAANRLKHAPLTASSRIAHHDTEAESDGPVVVTHLPSVSHEASSIDRLALSRAQAAPFDLSELESLIAAHGPDAVHEMVSERYAADDGYTGRRRKGEPPRLSENEVHVLVGLVSGAKYREIAERLGTTDKYVDNTIQRLRSKLREVLGDS